MIDQIGSPFEASRRGNAEHADLGRGIEAEPEQKTERIHVPAARNQPEHRPEQAAENAALRQQMIEVFLDEGAAAAHLLEGAIDRHAE